MRSFVRCRRLAPSLAISTSWLVWCMVNVNGQLLDATQCGDRPSYCTEESFDTYLPCPQAASAWPCMYTKYNVTGWKSLPTAPECSVFFPGAPRDISFSIYYFSKASKCHPALNITWKAPGDATNLYITGFQLNFTYFDPGSSSLSISRVFNISTPNNSNDMQMLMQRKFYYDCIPLMPGQVHRVSLQSLPLVPLSRRWRATVNHNITFITLPNSQNSAVPTFGSIINWKAEATVAPSDFDSTIDVSFQPAPVSYGYMFYNVTLVIFHENDAFLPIYRNEKLYPRHGELLQYRFSDVCPNTYRVMIAASLNDTCGCVWNRDGIGFVCEPCPYLEISPVYMNRSKCSTVGLTGDDDRCPILTTVMSLTTGGSEEKNQLGAAVGAAVGAVLAFLTIISVVIVTLLIMRRRREERMLHRLLCSNHNQDTSALV